MATLLYHPSFAVIPLLRGNSDAINQSNLRNLSAYIITHVRENGGRCGVLKAVRVYKILREI